MTPGRMELLPSEFAEVVELGREWLKVYKPCETACCESPTCRLAYAMRRAIAADETPGAFGPGHVWNPVVFPDV